MLRELTTYTWPGNARELRVEGAIHHVPQHAGFYHPDLVHASDAVIGKAGYSTLAEVYRAGVPFGYVIREGWRESDRLAAFIGKKMRGLAITAKAFESGAWLRRLDALLAMPRIHRRGPNGADQAADFIIELLDRK